MSDGHKIVFSRNSLSKEEGVKHTETLQKLFDVIDGEDMDKAINLAMSFMSKISVSYFLKKIGEVEEGVLDGQLANMLRGTTRILFDEIERKIDVDFKEQKHNITNKKEHPTFPEGSDIAAILSLVDKIMHVLNTEREMEVRMTALMNVTSFSIFEAVSLIGVPTSQLKEQATSLAKMFLEGMISHVESTADKIQKDIQGSHGAQNIPTFH